MMKRSKIKEEPEEVKIKVEHITKDCWNKGVVANDQLEDPLAISDIDIKQESVKSKVSSQNEVNPFSAESNFLLPGSEKTITLPNNSTVNVQILDFNLKESTGVSSPCNSSNTVKGSFMIDDFEIQYTTVSDDQSNSQEFGNLVIDLPAENNSSSSFKETNAGTSRKSKRKSDTKEPKEKKTVAKMKKCTDEKDEKICKHCGETFWNAGKLVLHLRKSYVCKLCFKGANNRVGLKKHLKSVHGLRECRPMPKCDMCKIPFETTQLSRAHMKEFNCGSKICKHCGIKTETRLEYEQHMMDFHASNEKCPFCNLVVKTRKIKKHYFSHTLVKLKLFLCSHCNVRFSSKNTFRTHKCPAAKDLVCEKCHFSCINFMEHDEHIEVCRNMVISSDSKPKNRNRKGKKLVYARNIWLQ